MLDRPEDDKQSETLTKIVGDRLRQARKRRKLTLKDVADRTGTTPQTISRLETGDTTISVEWIEKICLAVRTTPTEIFGPQSQTELADACHTLRYHAKKMQVLMHQCSEDLETFLERTEPDASGDGI